MPDPAIARRDTVVLIGGRARHEFEVLHDLGYRILFLDERVPLHCMAWADVPVDVDVADRDQVLATIQDHLAGTVPAAVLTHIEPRIPLMAELSEAMLPSPGPLSVETAWNCRDKWRTRGCLSDAGLPVPRFRLAFDPDEAAELASAIGLPAVVKPRDGVGAFGVRRCESADQVWAAAAAILTEQCRGRLPGVLVEEYLDGPEYAVQTLTCAGRTEVLSVFRQHMTSPPIFVELGYDYPSGLCPAELTDLEQLVAASLERLGLRDWVSHTQVRRVLDGFRIVEVNARRPGGRLVEMTTAVSGVDMILAASQLAVGLPVTRGAPIAGCARYSSVVFECRGVVRYQRTKAPDSPTAPIIEMDIESGETVLPVDDAEGGVYGRIVVFGDTQAKLDQAELGARAELDLTLTPVDDLTPIGETSREFKSCC